MTEDLYREISCPKCGQKVLAVASFCPHCGHVFGDSWFEKASRGLSSGSDPGQRHAKLIPVLMGIAIAGYFFYTAIQNESVQGFIVALLSLFFAIRAMFAGSSKPEQTNSEGHTAVHEVEDAPNDPLADKFFCENCGTRIAADETTCPKCGMKFG